MGHYSLSVMNYRSTAKVSREGVREGVEPIGEASDGVEIENGMQSECEGENGNDESEPEDALAESRRDE